MQNNNDKLFTSTQKKIQHITCLMAQTLRDYQLKTGLTDSLLLRNGNASAVIQAFVAKPLKFTQTHVISGDSIARMGHLPAHGRAQFVTIAPNRHDIEYVYNPSTQSNRLSVDAYFLGYSGMDQSAKTPAYVDIPINATEDSFLFTSTLTGGSVVVTQLNETTYRVYHDGRANSSLLYDNVMMAFDYCDYQIFSSDEALGMAYMRFQGGRWQLILQRQEYEVINGESIPILRTNEVPVSTLYADPKWVENHQQTFSTYREDIHRKLIQLALYFGIDAENIGDGIYIDGEFSLTHPAILPWLNFKNRINQRYEEKIKYIKNHIEQVKTELDKLRGKQTRSKKDNERINEITSIIESKKKLLNIIEELIYRY